MSLTGRTVLISGAARGIGRATALVMAAKGARVALFDKEASVADTVDAVRAMGAEAAHALGDVSDAASVAAGVAALVAALGPIDCLINNAGITNNIAPLARMGMDAWQREIGVNLTGPFNMIRAVVDGMAERGYGRIVNISSGAARGGLYNQVGYAATKTGLLGLTHNVCLEYGRKGVTCNAVLPGLIGTEVVMAMPAEIRDAFAGATPTRRVGTPSEVGHLIAFLCSEEAGFINGAEVDIDGGGRLNTMALGSRKELLGKK
jgi:NAD(P)-dependent dehydrogenase (short-subunit alcohol dehydrogenase family)